MQRSAVLRHLVEEYSEPFRDPVWKNIPLSEALVRIIGHPGFQKLNGIKQLGPTYLVYPGATHTRLNHSLGVFHLARRMLLHLLTNSSAVGGGPDLDGLLSLEGVKAFLCAALAHDLGHYPYAHSLKELQVRDHEALTAERIRQEDLAGLIRKELGTDPELVAAVVDPSLDYHGQEEVTFYRRLLSGVLDPDKLDYLNRDAYFCGVPYGIQDVDFVLAESRLHPLGLAITDKGLSAVESILFSKYLMYRTVYWHKTVRIATAMIKKAVLLALRAGVLRPENLYWLDDQQFYSLTGAGSFAPLGLVRRVVERRLYKAVARVPFEAGNAHHRALEDLGARLQLEEELAREAGRLSGRRVLPESIIVDIPEPISFEIDLPVQEAQSGRIVPYRRSDTVFSRQTVSAFRRSLRKISLIADEEQELGAVLERMGGSRLLEEGLG
jgi:HD superfamily phosphohydrolase